MTSLRNGLGLGLALSLGSFCFCFSAPALAQDDAPAPVAPASDDTTAKPAEAPAGTPAVEPAKEPEKVAAEVTPPKPLPSPTKSTASGTSPEREKAVALVGLEELPGSAYPSAEVRGIKYGSLWLTFHGQQWPYLPLIEGGPGLRIGVSGSIWNDFSNTHISVDKKLAGGGNALNDRNRWSTQTRGVLRFTPTYNTKDGWFAQGNAELVLHGDNTVDPITKVLSTTDDLWVRAGKWNLFDVQVGRFQGWEIANHYGMALDQNTLERAGAVLIGAGLPNPTDGYGLTYFWDRQDYLLGGWAAHVYPTKFLRGELMGHVGAGNSAYAGTAYQTDFRPSAIFDIGYVKLKAGLEYGKSIPQDKTLHVRDSRNGYGLAAQFVFAPWVEFGGSFARGFQDVLDKDGQADLNNSNTVQTFGGFINVSPAYEPVVLGFGAFQNHREDFRIDARVGAHQGKVDTNDQTQIFGAVQYTLWEQLYFKFVLAHAQNHVADFGAGTYTNKSMSGRFRVMFLF
jgi:hypothetical protein